MIKSFEVGIDEVGRGCLFGPVFSAAVILSPKNGSILRNLGLEDSKKLSHKKRSLLVPYIFALSEDWGIGQSSVNEIDKFGIRFATELSMIRAIDKLKYTPTEIFVDGPLSIRTWKGIQKNIIKGDIKFASIAAASVIAKVKRDALMNKFEIRYKGYYLSKNKGYGTREHFMSIQKKGLTKMHRKSFLKKLNNI
tara:strand:+ start:968 stop:1549 length:582 start_codon:yes stop_codon:yes gene_type:complete